MHVHQELRERLASVRREAADGAGPPGPRTAIGQDLLSHCLGFCAAIHAHHTGEDSQLLPALRAAAPELAPVIDNEPIRPDNSKKRGAAATGGVILAGLGGEGTVRSGGSPYALDPWVQSRLSEPSSCAARSRRPGGWPWSSGSSARSGG